tara:strand:- start:42 stop:323 length:282 start_codon:yes stop_codon:yes gene_type:complete
MDYNTDLDKLTLVDIMTEVYDDINNDELWDAYISISDAVRYGSPREVETFAEMTTMDMDEQLRWRQIMAEKGIELTPRQVEHYISLVELILGI